MLHFVFQFSPRVIAAREYLEFKTCTETHLQLSFAACSSGVGFISDAKAAFRESDNKQGLIKRNAAWRDQFFSVGRPQ